MTRGLLKTEDIKAFALAGNATLTVVNTKTSNRFTFKITQPKEKALNRKDRGPMPHFVKLLNGPENESSYAFLGTIFHSRDYRHGRRSSISPSAQSAKAFSWFWANVLSGSLPGSVKVYHEGNCGRCGRKLTVPESIASGIGPECAKALGKSQPKVAAERTRQPKSAKAALEALDPKPIETVDMIEKASAMTPAEEAAHDEYVANAGPDVKPLTEQERAHGVTVEQKARWAKNVAEGRCPDGCCGSEESGPAHGSLAAVRSRFSN